MTPWFHEFVVETADPAAQVNERLLEQKIVGGLSLQKWYPELGNASLWCATEQNTRAQMDAAAAVVSEKVLVGA
jgi:glycine dehydrogenase subunit 1